jgi:hypothetical protein
MNITICRSFNLDTLIEPFTTITYSTAATTQISDNRFSIIQHDIEPAMILKFADSNNVPINFSSTTNAPNYILKCTMGFKTTLLNQINTTTTQLISTYDPRYDSLCTLSIDDEKIIVSSCRHNKVLNRTYLTVVRNLRSTQHYRNSIIRVVRSRPLIGFLDKNLGYIKIYWTDRDVALTGIYELEAVFDRHIGDSRSKWTISPINIEVREDYSLGD